MEGKKTYLVSWIIAVLSGVAVALDQILGLREQLQLSLTQVAIITSLLAGIQAGLRSITITPPDQGVLSQSKWFAIIIAIIATLAVWAERYDRNLSQIVIQQTSMEVTSDVLPSMQETCETSQAEEIGKRNMDM